METHTHTSAGATRLWIAAAGLGAFILVAAAFGGWLHFGSAILLDLAATGLSWCF